MYAVTLRLGTLLICSRLLRLGQRTDAEHLGETVSLARDL